MSTKRTRAKRERGFVLIMGLTVLVFLTILGISVMGTVGEDLTAVRHMREAENALSIAEAGVAWGLEQLNKDPHFLNTITDSSKYTAILNDTNFQALDWNDDEDKILCKGLRDAAANCDKWRELPSPPAFLTATSFNNESDPAEALNGTFRVVVGDDDDDGDLTTDTNRQILIRALGQDGRGSKRLIEVLISAGAP